LVIEYDFFTSIIGGYLYNKFEVWQKKAKPPPPKVRKSL